jgi:hypothetical protein
MESRAVPGPVLLIEDQRPDPNTKDRGGDAPALLDVHLSNCPNGKCAGIGFGRVYFDDGVTTVPESDES